MLSRILTLAFLISFSFLSAETIYLKQKDFDNGTYIIEKPGKYILAEDISFSPNSPATLGTDAYGAGFVLPEQYKSKGGKYEDASYGIGFFAAIAIPAEHVTLDLNGHTIEQSKEHSLLMRFFAIIELADQPFVPGEGPHNFGDKITSAKNVVIKNGTIGRSAHHGIHGNGNRNVKIENIRFKDFEVAAVALNGVQGLVVENCTAESSRDVPVIGTFSAVRFLKPYLDYLVESGSQTRLNIGGKGGLTPREARSRIQSAVNTVHEDLVTNGKPSIDESKHPEEYALFHNPTKVIDGNCYGFLINSMGQAIHGFPVQDNIKHSELAKDIAFKNVHVKRLEGKVNEIIALRLDEEAMVDPVGAVFQVMNLHPDTRKPITVEKIGDKALLYTGNLLANAQALVAKAHLSGDFKGSNLDLTRLTITQEVIDWIEANPALAKEKLEPFTMNREDFVCNADSMFHVNKGVIGFKIDGSSHVTMENTSAENIANLSEVGSDVCGHYITSHPKATLEGCGGPKTRGYTFSGSGNVMVRQCSAKGIKALCGTAAGIDIMTDSSHVEIKDGIVEDVEAGKKFIHNNAPNELPLALGFRISPKATDIALVNVCARKLDGFAGAKQVMDESHRARIVLDCKPLAHPGTDPL